MTRLLVVALLLHHIEGVCKPRSPVRQLMDVLMAQHDHEAAVERAKARRDAGTARAEAKRQVQASPRRGIGRGPEPTITFTITQIEEEENVI